MEKENFNVKVSNKIIEILDRDMETFNQKNRGWYFKRKRKKDKGNNKKKYLWNSHDKKRKLKISKFSSQQKNIWWM